MRVTQNKTSKGTTFYIIRSVSGGSTEIVEKLGTEQQIMEQHHCTDALAWARQRAKELTEKEKESQSRVMIPLQPHALIAKGETFSLNVGYLFLQQIYYALGLHKVCHEISRRRSLSYDLNEVLSDLVYGRILAPSSRLAASRLARSFLEQPSFRSENVQRALAVLAEESDFIQEQLYQSCAGLTRRIADTLYCDCVSFCYEMEEEMPAKGRQRGNSPHLTVPMELFTDRRGLPLSFHVPDGSSHEQMGLTPLEQRILADAGSYRIVVRTDSAVSPLPHREFRNSVSCSYAQAVSLRSLPKQLQDRALSPQGWKLPGQAGVFDISKLDETSESYKFAYSKVFYKEYSPDGQDRETGDTSNPMICVTYSLRYRDYVRSLRNAQAEHSRELIGQDPVKAGRRNRQTARKEKRMDGFSAFFSDSGTTAEDILGIDRNRWEIDRFFRTMKAEFRSVPDGALRDDHIKAHLLVSFIALTIDKILEEKLDGTFTSVQIADCLRKMNVVRIGDVGYLPAYRRTDLTDALHEAAGFRTDCEILRRRYMQGVINRSRKY